MIRRHLGFPCIISLAFIQTWPPHDKGLFSFICTKEAAPYAPSKPPDWKSKQRQLLYLLSGKAESCEVLNTTIPFKSIDCQTAEPSLPLTKETMNSLLKLAESDAERKRLQFAVVSATGISIAKAKVKYGFSNAAATVSEVEQKLDEIIAEVKD